jgi:hypothetical protein
MVNIPKNKASAGRILIKPRGEWDANITYEMLDLVNHNGYAFLAKRTVVGIEPSDEHSSYWHNMLDIKKIVDNTIAETIADDVGNVLEERFGDRLGEVETKCAEIDGMKETVEELSPIPDKVKNLEDNTYTKTETLTDKTREILGLGAESTPDKAFATTYSNLVPIPSYLTFVGKVNEDMVAAAFGKGNEDEVHGVGKALKMYANFKGNTENINFLDGYDKYSDLVKNYKQKLISNEALYSLIGSSTYANELLKNTNTGLPDIVVYDSGSTDYLNLSQATCTRESPLSGSCIVSGNVLNVEAVADDVSSGNPKAVVCSIPLRRSLPDLRGYRYLRIKLSDGVPSGFYNVFNDFAYGQSKIYSKAEIIVGGIAYQLPVTSFPNNSYYSSINITGITTVEDYFSTYTENPTASDIKIKLYLLAHSDTTQRMTVNVEKIWITET